MAMSKRRFNLRTNLILVYAIGATLYGAWLFTALLRLPTDGCGGIYVKQGIAVSQLPPWPTSLRTGDLIAQIDGQDVRYALLAPRYWYESLFGSPTTPMTYVLFRDGTQITADVPWHEPSPGWFLPRSASFLILGAVFILSGALVAWRRGQDLAARLMALALISEGLNLLNNIVLSLGANTGLALAWFSIPVDILSFSITFSAFFHCLLLFPEVKWLGQRLPRLLYLVHLFNPIASLVGGLLFGGDTPLGIRSQALSSLYVVAGVELIVGIGHLVHTYLTTKRPGVRNQVRWLIWGLIVAALPWLLAYNIPYIAIGRPLLPLYLVILPLILIPITLLFSIARYRLMAIDTLINRSLVYGVLTGVLVVINLLVVTLCSNVLRRTGSAWNETTAVVLSTLIAVITSRIVGNDLQQWIDRAFYKGRLNFERLLREMGERLTTTLVFDNLVTLLTEYVPARLQIARAILFTSWLSEEAFTAYPEGAFTLGEDSLLVAWLRREGKPLVVSQFRDLMPNLSPELESLAQSEIEICLPLRRGDKLIGMYALGRKRSGDLYDDQEMDTLTLLAHQIVSAMENARLYREVEEYSRTLESQVQKRTAELREANGKLADTALDLAEQRARLDAILQNIADGLVVTDPDGRIVLTNAVFEQIVDVSSGMLQGVQLQEAFPDRGLIDIVYQAQANVGQPFSGEVTATTGEVYKASACAMTQGSVVAGVTTVLRDVTHEVRVDRMKTDFISIVSHELRTPLTSVLGFAKLIHRNFESAVVPKIADDDRHGQRAAERIKRNLEIIESESQRLTRLINNVLDIAKMEAGKIDWHMADMRIQDAVDSAVAATSSLAADKPIQIHAEIEPELPTVTADLDRIIQVVNNLLSNAIKFTDKGQVVVRAWQLDPGQDIPPQGTRAPDMPTGLPASIPMLVVSVTDTGTGIRPEDLSQVFERFRQVDDPETYRPRGTGLGLPICREIVEHHRGRIWVESTPGQGSRFVFTLPLQRAEQGTERAPSAERYPHAQAVEIESEILSHLQEGDVREIHERVSTSLPQGLAGKQTILVVDDDPSIRLLLRQELTDAGYQVIEASGGLAAVELARSRQPDLILLDVMMPGLSGFDVTSVLKSDERTKHIPILILSIIEDREKGLRLGADEYLTKPVHAERLLDAISALLQVSATERRALVVDQDESAVQAITYVLRERGFEVTAAYDPRGAIQKAIEVRPDLVILDAMLSQLNDYQIIKALNYKHLSHRVDILVLAGSTAE
jgi:PAS domain S-box-containing protein